MPRFAPLHQRGFTLIELIVVIVILGVLAATALPRFISMKDDAARATLEGVRGAVASSMNSAYAKCLMIPGCYGAGVVQFNIEGGWKRFIYGYPDSGDNVNADIGGWIRTSGVTVVNVSGRTRFQVDSATTPSACYVEYREATALGAVPTITTVSTGC